MVLFTGVLKGLVKRTLNKGVLKVCLKDLCKGLLFIVFFGAV